MMKNHKGKLLIGALLMMALSVAFVAPAYGDSGNVTVELLDSDGAGIDGATVSYYDGGWQPMGTTGDDGAGTGKVTGSVPKTTDIEIRGPAGSFKWKNVDPSTNPTLSISTIEVTVKLETCDGTPLVGKAQRYYQGWKDVGDTEATIELLPYYDEAQTQKNWYDFHVVYDNRTSATITRYIADDPVVVFKTTKVNFNTSDSVWWYNNGGWQPFTSPKEVIGGPGKWADFKFGDIHNPTVRLDIDGCSVEKSPVTIKLVDSVGNGLEGGIAKYDLGGWQTAGTTDSNGEVFVLLDGLQKTLAFRMYWEDTYVQKNQNVSTNSTVVFQTVLVKMELHSSLGAQLTGEGKVDSGSWKSLGNTPTAGTELLPKTYAFRIYYEDTYIQKNQNVASDPLVVFDTVLVKMELHSSLGAQLTGEGKVDSGSWKTLGNTPTTGMELLPKTYAFRIYYEDTYIQKNQNVASDPLVVFDTVLVKMELHSSLGAQLTGEGKVDSGSWKSLGNTPTAGTELLPKTYAFRIYYEDTYIQKNQNVASDPLVVFDTVLVKMELHSSTGAQLTGEGKVDSGSWKSLGNTPTAGMELLPKTYAFRIYYEDTYIQKNQDVKSDQLVVFETVSVTMRLLDADDNDLVGEGKVDSGSWKSLGNTPTSGMELLPKTYAFRVYYEGTYLQKNQNVADDAVVIFRGTTVTIQFTGDIQYNSGGWKTFTKPTMTLLPKTYAFKFSGSGYPAVQKNIQITGSEMELSVAYFRLLKSDGNPLSGGEAKYDLGGWQSAGITNSQGVALAVMDGLRGTLAFRMYYEDTYVQKNQNIASNSFVIFQTALVKMELHSSLGAQLTGEGEVNSGSWKTLGNTPTAGTELLPKSYAFRIYYEDTYIEKNQNVASDPLVVFDTVLAKMELHSSLGAQLTGEGKVDSGSWKTLGNTPTAGMELLPKTYAFRIYYEDTYIQKNQNVASDPLVIFDTVLVKMELHSSLGAQLIGEGKVDSGSWKSLGNTPTTGMELLPKTYAFRIYYEDAYIQKNQDVKSDQLVVFETVLVTMRLLDSDDNDLVGEGKVDSGSWKSLGNTPTAGMELLPKTYAFRVYYEGTYTQKNQNVASDPDVVFVWD